MLYRNLVLVSLVVLVAGCDAATPEETAESAFRGAPCGHHAGRYISTVGAQTGGDVGCLYRPTIEDVILPAGPASIACMTSERQDFRLLIDPRVQVSEVINCTWTKNGDHADCTLTELADEGQASCWAGFALTYDRVPVVVW